MARQRNPKRDEAYQLYKDSGGTIKLSDLADRLHIPASRVRKWKSEDHWEQSERSDCEKERSFSKKVSKKVKKKLLKSVNENDELTEQRRLFCLYCAISHNAFQSYLKAYKCTKETAMTNGPALLRITQVFDEIKRLRNIMRNELDVTVVDLLQYCLKVINADLGDYVTVESGYVKLVDSRCVDTTLLTEVKKDKKGVSIKLADKKWAWEMLAKYLGFDEELELKKARLRAEVKKINAADKPLDNPDVSEYVKALQGEIVEVWSDEPEEE